jgi:hypothetical protein
LQRQGDYTENLQAYQKGKNKGLKNGTVFALLMMMNSFAVN